MEHIVRKHRTNFAKTSASWLTFSGAMIPRSINWLALLLAAFTMLSVSVESCMAARVVVEEDQPHALVTQDDHQELGKVASSTSVPDFARPDLPRPYRCSGYPYTRAVFIVVSILFVVALLYDPSERTNALYGLGILATGIPYYWWWNKRYPAKQA